MLFIIGVYAAQLIVGLWPHMNNASTADYTATFICAMFSIGIARSWELLGMQGGGAFSNLRGALSHGDSQSPQGLPGPADSSAPGDRADPVIRPPSPER